jgi:hypothetical protein
MFKTGKRIQPALPEMQAQLNQMANSIPRFLSIIKIHTLRQLRKTRGKVKCVSKILDAA